MKRSLGFCLILSLVLISAAPLVAQDQNAPATKEERARYSGTVANLNKDASSFTLQGDNNKIQIYFDANTKITNHNEAGTSADLKDGQRVICLVDAKDTSKLTARRIDIRENK